MSNTAFCELSEAERLRQLAALRAELDRVDDGLHDQLMRRAALVAQVGALGVKGAGAVATGSGSRDLAPSGGAECGLVGGCDAGAGVAGDAGGEFGAAAADAGRGGRCRLAGGGLRAFRGVDRGGGGDARRRPGATAGRDGDAGGVADAGGRGRLVDRVARGAAFVSWWRGCPFWARAGVPEALVISSAAPDASGKDRTLVAGAGLTVGRRLAMAGDVVLAEVDGLVAADDPLLAGLAMTVLGAYAVQMGDER